MDVGNGPDGPVRVAVEDCASGRGLANGYLALKAGEREALPGASNAPAEELSGVVCRPAAAPRTA